MFSASICFISQWMKRSKHGLFVFPIGQSCCILGVPGADSGDEGKSKRAEKYMARRKVKNGEKSPWGQCLTRPVPNGHRRSGFWLVPEKHKFSARLNFSSSPLSAPGTPRMIVLQYDVKAKCRLISRKFSGMKFFHPSVCLTVCIRSINQSDRSISLRLLFLFCSRLFISRSHENRSNEFPKRVLMHKEWNCEEFCSQTRRGGKICSSDFNLHNGQFSQWVLDVLLLDVLKYPLFIAAYSSLPLFIYFRSLYHTFGSPFADSPCRPHEIGRIRDLTVYMQIK